MSKEWGTLFSIVERLYSKALRGCQLHGDRLESKDG